MSQLDDAKDDENITTVATLRNSLMKAFSSQDSKNK